MDGFHLTRDQLRAMPNPEEAFVRRGAEWTFDPRAFGQLLAQLAQDSKEPVQAPTFDHAVKDPVQGGVVILPQHRIVIVEGIYTQLNFGLWATAALPYFPQNAVGSLTARLTYARSAPSSGMWLPGFLPICTRARCDGTQTTGSMQNL